MAALLERGLYVKVYVWPVERRGYIGRGRLLRFLEEDAELAIELWQVDLDGVGEGLYWVTPFDVEA